MTEFLQYAHIRINGMDFLRWLLAGIAAAFTYFFGGADKLLISLAALVLLDYLSGIGAAAIHKELSSKRGLAGIIKKTLLFCIVAVANIVDTATDAGGVLRSLTIGFLAANEGISVLENTARCGVRWPNKLMAALEQLRGECDPDTEKPPDGEDPDPDEPYDGDGSGD